MTQSTTPTDPDPRFVEFIEKSNAIAGEKLAAAIPREYMQPSVARGFAGFAVSWSLYIGAIVGIAVLDRWYLVAPLVLVAGLGGWGLHCIGHDCGHGSILTESPVELRDRASDALAAALSVPRVATRAQFAPRPHQQPGIGHRLAADF